MSNEVPVQLVGEDPNCVIIDDRAVIAEKYQTYLGDESKCDHGIPALLAFPETIEQVAHVLNRSYRENRKVTVSSGRTGLVGGAAAEEGGAVISLERMTRISKVQDGQTLKVRVGSGVRLLTLQKFLADELPDQFYPIDPSEANACFGGMASINASGARSYFYGTTREWLTWMRVILPGGGLLELRRGEYSAHEGRLVFNWNGEKRELIAGDIAKPNAKCTAGYTYSQAIDPIDIFIGSEGTLGIITDLELRLTPKPRGRLYYLQFFYDEETAFRFVEEIRREKSLKTLAIEFVDEQSLRLVTQSVARKMSRAIQMIRPEFRAAIFCDLIAESDREFEQATSRMDAVAQRLHVSMEMSFAGTDDNILQDIKAFRHAIPERINSLIAERKLAIPSLHKISTDVSVAAPHFREMYDFYGAKLRSEHLEHYIFGHIASFHLHVNIVPRTEQERKRAMELYGEFAAKAASLGGAISAEHGIGRLKKHLLPIQCTEGELKAMKTIKLFFDPRGLLSSGTLLDAHE